MYVRVGADSSPPSFGKVSNQLNTDLTKFTKITKTYTSDAVGRIHLTDVPSTATNCICNMVNNLEYSCSSPYKANNAWCVDLTMIVNVSLPYYVLGTDPNVTVTMNIMYC